MSKKQRKETYKPKICFLSGLPIPQGKMTKEHIVPRCCAPTNIISVPYNIQPAIKIINNIKGPRLLCEWEDQKISLCYNALEHWNLKQSDKDVIIRALDRFATEKEPLIPCQRCVLSQATEYCYARRDLEKYRIRWLYGIKQGESQKQK